MSVVCPSPTIMPNGNHLINQLLGSPDSRVSAKIFCDAGRVKAHNERRLPYFQHPWGRGRTPAAVIGVEMQRTVPPNVQAYRGPNHILVRRALALGCGTWKLLGLEMGRGACMGLVQPSCGRSSSGGARAGGQGRLVASASTSTRCSWIDRLLRKAAAMPSAKTSA